MEAPSRIVSFTHKNHEVTFQNHAQSTDLAEYVRKTVLESKIGSLDKKLQPNKVRIKKSKKFPQTMILVGFCLTAQEDCRSAVTAKI